MLRLNTFCATLALTSALALSASATERFVAPDGNDANDGSASAPFATVDKGLSSTNNGDTLTVRAGTYRLMDGGSGEQFSRPGGTAQSHVTIRAELGAKVTLLGSLSSEGKTWENASGGLYRLDVGSLPHDPTGLFTGDTRIEHVMKTVDGVRSHGDIADLKNPGEWTKADAGGAGCPSNNAGCWVYLFPPSGLDPNSAVFELSQRKLLQALGTSYLEVRGFEILYTQDSALSLEGGDHELIEDNVFGHNSNGDDNAYSIFVSYGRAVTIRNNRAFDSKYWGGFANSKGLTLMDMDPSEPSLIEGNEVYDIVGQGIASKDGVSQLLVRGNFVHDTGVCVEVPTRRCDWTNPSCATSDPENYPGGNWTINENAFVRCGSGVSFRAGEQNQDNRVFNNVFYDCDAGVDVVLGVPGTLIANNVFASNRRGVFLDHGDGGETKTFDDFSSVFEASHNSFFANDDDYLLRPDWTGADGSGTGSTLSEVQTAHGIENASLAADPMFVDAAGNDFHLAEASPARAAGDGALYQLATVDIGRYPLGDASGGGLGGASGSGGSTSAGGASSGGSNASGGGNAAGDTPSASSDDSGCGCRVTPVSGSSSWDGFGWVFAVAWFLKRRQIADHRARRGNRAIVRRWIGRSASACLRSH